MKVSEVATKKYTLDKMFFDDDKVVLGCWPPREFSGAELLTLLLAAIKKRDNLLLAIQHMEAVLDGKEEV